MTSIHSSFGTLGNLPITSSDSDLATRPYSSSALEMVSHDVAPSLKISGPLQLPRFVFPAKTSPELPSAVQSYPKDAARRPYSLISLRPNDPLNVQDSIFNEFRYSHLGTCNDSPPVSPRTHLARSELYKSVTSEHTGNEKMIQTPPTTCKLSPKVNDSNSEPPITLGQRRGHAHRRSAAISSGDLSLILRPSYTRQAGGSLPPSPNSEPKTTLLSKSLSSPSEFGMCHANLSEELNVSTKTPKNTRVGFSDDIQIIPRPLSLDSCDSVGTLRPAHSVSNSISSVVSGSQPLAHGKEECSISLSFYDRPRTAESASDDKRSKYFNHEPKRSGSLPILLDMTTGTPLDSSTPRSMKRWTFFSNELNSGASTPKSRPTSSTSSYHEQQSLDVSCKLEQKFVNHTTPSHDPVLVRRTTVFKKQNKSRKRVKSWAGSILSHKTRQRSHKQTSSRNSQHLPRILVTPLNSETIDTVDQRSEPSNFETQKEYTNWKPRSIPLQDEPISPVIDLDAALGPFNTPNLNFGESWDSSRRGVTRKRFMHSAAGLCGFTGPGMHYHRRSESAPEFENPRFGYHRLGSNSTMAMEDVFEEDEDEEWEDTKSSVKNSCSKSGINEDDVNLETEIEILADEIHVPSEYTAKSTIPNIQTEIAHKTCIGKANECFNSRDVELKDLSKKTLVNEIISVSGMNDGDTSSRNLDTPTSVSAEKFRKEEYYSVESPSASLDLPQSIPGLSNAATKSPLPSPVSTFSYDTQFISTAPPSVNNDHEFESLLLGEPGPELRVSVDDVPSLTSSDSASNVSVTNVENVIKNDFPEARLRDGKRSASFSATIANRKRSSIASLSRLISSSHGERSKLALESRAPSYSEVECSQKSGNIGKRISRLMKFWKKSDGST